MTLKVGIFRNITLSVFICERELQTKMCLHFKENSILFGVLNIKCKVFFSFQ